MGWLWIPLELFHNPGSKVAGKVIPDIIGMKLYLLFDRATARPWGMRGVYMGLANRRGIWNVCTELRSRYLAHIAMSGRSLTAPDAAEYTSKWVNEVDTLWKEAFERLESVEQWLSKL